MSDVCIVVVSLRSYTEELNEYEEEIHCSTGGPDPGADLPVCSSRSCDMGVAFGRSDGHHLPLSD
ncbi:hypothetical protein SDC9_111498 [bioreactor metagenome]|uniref:Uncharacterized protein n=1 Tax=bioreactor metagenome TaxID=1076179 RepID=A0A645BJ77_9ZZZZ